MVLTRVMCQGIVAVISRKRVWTIVKMEICFFSSSFNLFGRNYTYSSVLVLRVSFVFLLIFLLAFGGFMFGCWISWEGLSR